MGGRCEDGQPDEQGRVGAARAGHSDEDERETCRRARREGYRSEQGERTQGRHRPPRVEAGLTRFARRVVIRG